MSEENKALETRVRDNEENIRNLNRICGETVTAIRSLHQRMSKAQEFALRDSLLTAEDLKETLEKYKTILEAGKRDCATHRTRTSTIETDIKWIKGGLVSAWVAILGLFGIKQ